MWTVFAALLFLGCGPVLSPKDELFQELGANSIASLVAWGDKVLGEGRTGELDRRELPRGLQPHGGVFGIVMGATNEPGRRIILKFVSGLEMRELIIMSDDVVPPGGGLVRLTNRVYMAVQLN
jgi:hypothetical protein